MSDDAEQADMVISDSDRKLVCKFASAAQAALIPDDGLFAEYEPMKRRAMIADLAVSHALALYNCLAEAGLVPPPYE